MCLPTADLYDRYEEQLRVFPPMFRDFGGRRCFQGSVSTVKCFEDNSQVKAALAEPGEGRVLVIDGGGSLRCALLGDLIAESAVASGWSGVIIQGCVRDSARLAELDLGVKALASNPRKSIRRGEGQRDVAIEIAGVCIQPGDWAYCDRDGVIVAREALNLD